MDNAGKAIVAGLLGVAVWHNMSDRNRQRITGFLDQVAQGIEEREREKKRLEQEERERERQRFLAAYMESILKGWRRSRGTPVIEVGPGPAPVVTSGPTTQRAGLLLPGPGPDNDARWREVIIPAAVVLILGKRGSGKSALAYRLLELFRYQLTPYVVGVPTEARRLLPEWIGIVPSIEELPHKCIVLVDEAYLHYHARGSMARESKAMSQIINLSRQREQTLIFVSQEARQVDRNIASSASVVVFKDLGMLQLEFDRPELRRLTTEARELFSKVSGDRRRWSYVYSPDADFMGMLENELASFWKPKLSHLFTSGPGQVAPRRPDKMTPGQKAERANQLRQQGLSFNQIASELGVSKGTVINYIRGYPYRSP
ncbi:MAG: hypothetical protein V3U79_10610 [Dehalococcoidia bacterium]